MISPRIVHGLNLARSGVYFLEALPFSLATRWMTQAELPPPTPAQVRTLWKHISLLHEREAQNLERGVYPTSAVEIENPLRHLRSYLEMLADELKVACRIQQTPNQGLSPAARRYDHQVEILFSGTAGAMRRLILPVLKQAGHADGHWLELGCGSGAATKPVLETFPHAKITALDISAPCLKVAQRHLTSYSPVDFIQGNATDLDFKNSTFDVVYSVFLLHELPKAERAALVREAYRVLKPGGLLVLADSLQWDDVPELNWALERFPKSYHEPLYKSYVEEDLQLLVDKTFAGNSREQHAFFTKVVWIQKSASSALS